jgi:hypothetical protein
MAAVLIGPHHQNNNNNNLESWLREEICNAELFRANFTTSAHTEVPVVVGRSVIFC